MGCTGVSCQARTFSLAWAVVALALWTGATAEAQKIEGLSTTWVGELVAGEAGRLAVSWSGTPGAELSVWVDFDGERGFGGAELVVDRAVLGARIEIYEVQLPAGAMVDERTQMRLRLRGAGERTEWEIVRSVWAEKGGEECEWASGFHIQGMSGPVFASAVFDDGSGPALYAGGSFTVVDGTTIYFLAKWDGATWSPLDSGIFGTIKALTVHDDGSGLALYAGGFFTTTGDGSASRVAKWNGTTWAPLGTGVNDVVETLAVYDDGSGPALYAGGRFTTAGGISTNRIAKWDGAAWSALGSGVDDLVSTLAVYDDGSGPALYVGGYFNTSGGVSANGIAKWDGATWTPLSSGVAGNVYALNTYDDGGGPVLYVGGIFFTAGGVSARNIARWDGVAWAPLGTGTGSSINDLTVYDDGSGSALYAVGRFDTAGGVEAHRIAKWDGATWAPLSSGIEEDAYTLTVYDDGEGPALYVGGTHFETAGGVLANRIAKWDGTTWTMPTDVDAGSGIGDIVRAWALYDDGSGPALYAGGDFKGAGGVLANGIAKWDGAGWTPLGAGVDSPFFGGGIVAALAVHDDGSGPALYAGGYFNSAGGISVGNIARWNGAGWAPLDDTGLNNTIYALAVHDDGSGAALYAGGNFTAAGSGDASHIAKWDGAAWTPLGTGLNSSVDALMSYDDGSGAALYAVGTFTTAGGVGANRIAKWDGAAWIPLGTGMNGRVSALTVHDDGGGPALYAGGDFTTAGGMSANRVAKWTGSTWAPLGTGLAEHVNALAVYNDGSGPALYVGGYFTSAGGVSARRIAKWDGAAWSPLGNGMSASVVALTGYDDGSGPALYAGGGFVTAGSNASSNIAKWACPTSELVITKTNDAEEVTAGGTTTYTIVASNLGPADATIATLTDTFPPDLTCSWSSTPTGGATGNTAGSGPSLDDSLSMPAGSTVTYTVTCDIDPDAAGQLTNTATISAAGDPNLDNNVAVDTDTVLQESDLAITLINGTDTIIADGTATYSLVVTNDGPSDAAPTTLSDTFPPELTDCRWQSTTDGGASGNTAATGPAINDTLTMPAGSTARYVITCAVPAAATGTVTHTAAVTSPTDPNATNNTATDTDPIITATIVRTIILTHVQRLLTLTDPDAGDLETLLTRLHDFAAHPNVQGLVIDVGYAADLAELYAAWDADVAVGGTDLGSGLANQVLFGCHTPLPTGCDAEKEGLHDLLRQQLTSHPEAGYLMLVGDDRILPMARVRDFTFYTTEIDYTPLGTGGLTPGLTATNTTVGQAAAGNRYLSDDPITLRGLVDIALLDEFLASFQPELAAGRLVETPAEIAHSLDVFLALNGMVDLTMLDPDHRVLVTGYDFLIDSSRNIRRRWKNVYGETVPHDPDDLIPVDGQLVSRTWDLPTAAERADALLEHLSGRGLGHYGIMNLNGHATHYQEGVPSGSVTDIQGLSTAELDTLDLTGSAVYAVGCHGGLPVAGTAATAADHPLDLPQTMLRRGVLAYIANSGFGWGLRHGVGYSERLVEILTDELSRGGTVTFGDAVGSAKTRYYFEDFFVDSYDVKTSMQWTLFGFPMVSIHTGIAGPTIAEPEKDGVAPLSRNRDIVAHPPSSRGGDPPPDHLLVEPRSFVLTAGGLFTKYTALGEVVPAGITGCPPPSAGEDPGCYYTLNGLATNDGDLPIEPFLLEFSMLTGTSQHGILWLGGSYEEETGWVPLFAELVSNGGTIPLPGSLPPRMEWVHPRDGRRGGPSANEDDCRPTDTVLNNVGVVPAELLFDDELEPIIHRLHREIDLELFYYNNTATGVGNCDRIGPEFGDGPYHTETDTVVHWSVPATDDGGVWRVVAVYDDVANNQWLPVELTYDAPADRWQGDLVFPGGATDLVYFLQAVDNRGNVSWAEFVPDDASPSGIERRLAMPFEVVVSSIFSDGFETGDCSRWSSCP